MLVIYSKDAIKSSGKEFIWDVEGFFPLVEKELLKMKELKEITKAIDGAVYIENHVFKGKFGICTFKDLSTGCKAVLLSAYFKDSKIINYSECGNNAYDVAQNLNINCHVYANRNFILKDVFSKFYYNGNLVNTLEFSSLMLGGV